MTILRSLSEAAELGFGKYFCPTMLLSRYRDGAWSPLETVPYAPLGLEPASKVFHYAQEIFEGLKVFRQPDGGLALFRPEENVRRMSRSAEILALPAFPEAEFLRGLDRYSRELEAFVPQDPGALYLRPTMLGTSPTLGVSAAKEAVFFVCASPVGGYFGSLKSDKPAGVSIWITPDHVRAVRGGLGAAKCGANYAASLRAVSEAKRLGFDNVLFLDAIERRYFEELSGMNVFVVEGTTLRTPPLGDTILDGITRKSIFEVARSLGYKVEESPVAIDDVERKLGSGQLGEVFACGTGASVTAVTSLGWKGQKLRVGEGQPGPVTTAIYRALLDIQYGRKEAPKGWLRPV